VWENTRRSSVKRRLSSNFILNPPFLSTATISSSSIIIAMSDLLIEPKLVVLDHMKALPEAPMAEDEDFEVWGMRFCKVLVSRTMIVVLFYFLFLLKTL
jgi:hypothetical protein